MKARGYHYCVVERRPVETEYAALFEKARETFECFAPHPERSHEGVWLHKLLVQDRLPCRATRSSASWSSPQPERPRRTPWTPSRRPASRDPSRGSEAPSEKAPAGVPTSSPAGSGRSSPASPPSPNTTPSRPSSKKIRRRKSRSQKNPGKAGKEGGEGDHAPRIVDLVWTLNSKREERNLLTGTYVIETSHADRTRRDIWSLYTTLTEVEGRPLHSPPYSSRSWTISFSRTSSPGSVQKARPVPEKRSALSSAPSAAHRRGPGYPHRLHRLRLSHPDDLDARTGTPGHPRQARHQGPSPSGRFPFPLREEAPGTSSASSTQIRQFKHVRHCQILITLKQIKS